MPVKVYFDIEIHRFPKLPANFKALTDTITSIFRAHLPVPWMVQYTDQDGDLIVITHDHDYQELLETESKALSSTIKLVITAAPNGDKISIPPKMEDSFEVVAKPSQNNREETANADFKTTTTFVGQNQHIEVLPQANPLPQEEGLQLCSTNDRADQIECPAKLKKHAKCRKAKKQNTEKLSEEQLKVFQASKTLKKFLQAQNKGNQEEVLKLRAELDANTPEFKIKLDSLLEDMKQKEDKKQLKELSQTIKTEFWQLYDPNRQIRGEKPQKIRKAPKSKEDNECELIVEEPNEQQIRVFENFGTFRAIIQAYKKGETAKIAEYQAALESNIPEVKPMMIQASQVIAEGADQKIVRNAINNVKAQLVQQLFQGGKKQMNRQLKHWRKTQRKATRQQNRIQKVVPELSEQQARIFANKAVFTDMINAYKVKDAEKVLEYRAKLESEIPELKHVLDLISLAFAEEHDQKEVRNRMKNAKTEFLKEFFPPGVSMFRKLSKQYKASLAKESNEKPKNDKARWFWSQLSKKTEKINHEPVLIESKV